ncbi:hypothetical protein STEG23_015227, partial [Scotinomys teguina]
MYFVIAAMKVHGSAFLQSWSVSSSNALRHSDAKSEIQLKGGLVSTSRRGKGKQASRLLCSLSPAIIAKDTSIGSPAPFGSENSKVLGIERESSGLCDK